MTSLGLAPASTAMAADTTTGSLVGHVTGPQDEVPPTATLMVATFDAPDNQPHNAVRVDAAGNFRIDGLTPGEYRFRVSDERNGATQYAARWVGPAKTYARARAITVTGNESINVGSTAMRTGGSVSGVATGLHSAPLTTPTYVTGITMTGDFVGIAGVRADGSYVVGGFPTGKFTLLFSDNRVALKDQYWRGSLTLAGAHRIHTRLGRTHHVRTIGLIPISAQPQHVDRNRGPVLGHGRHHHVAAGVHSNRGRGRA